MRRVVTALAAGLHDGSRSLRGSRLLVSVVVLATVAAACTTGSGGTESEGPSPELPRTPAERSEDESYETSLDLDSESIPEDFTLDLDGAEVRFVREDPSTTMWTAMSLADERLLGVAHFVTADERVAGSMATADALYHFSGPVGEALTVTITDPASLPDEESSEFGSVSEPDVNHEDLPSGTPESSVGSLVQPLEVDVDRDVAVFVAYTREVELNFPGATADIALEIARANDVFFNSEIDVELALAGTIEVDYVGSRDAGKDLDRLNSTADGFLDGIHHARDASAGDLVVLVVDQLDDACGRANLHLVSGNADDDDAFAVVARPCFDQYSFVHEIGHIAGAHHDWGNDPFPIPNYAHGLVDEDGGWRTVMAYDQCRDFGSTCRRVPHFSNPRVLYMDGRTTGGSGLRAADNARRINETSSTLSRFRIDGPRASFYEGNRGTQDHVCVLPTTATGAFVFDDSTSDARWCDNDEARSMRLFDVQAGTILRLYDDPGGSRRDDWTEVVVLADINDVLVESFESVQETHEVLVTPHPRNGLDGKVSRVEVSSGSPTTSITLFEGNNQSQDVVCDVEIRESMAVSLASVGCANDEARSARVLNPLPDSTVRLYDSPSASLGDDWTEIQFGADPPLVFEIDTFEQSLSFPGVEVAYSALNGLDGKVSFLSIRLSVDAIDLELFEGNGFQQDRFCVLPAHAERTFQLTTHPLCSNDEARSARLVGARPGQVILFFDSSSGSREDDWGLLQVEGSGVVELPTFENSSSGPSFRYSYLRNNGLDGKVSRVEVYDDFRFNGILSLYEGGNASQNKVCDLDMRNATVDLKSSSACDNDEARSVQLTLVPAGSRIGLFDDPDCERGDDWISIEVLRDVGQVIVPNLERSFRSADLDVAYHRDNGLNGKVSCVRIQQ